MGVGGEGAELLVLAVADRPDAVRPEVAALGGRGAAVDGEEAAGCRADEDEVAERQHVAGFVGVAEGGQADRRLGDGGAGEGAGAEAQDARLPPEHLAAGGAELVGLGDLEPVLVSGGEEPLRGDDEAGLGGGELAGDADRVAVVRDVGERDEGGQLVLQHAVERAVELEREGAGLGPLEGRRMDDEDELVTSREGLRGQA